MNRVLVSAALLAAFTAAVHIVAGGGDVAVPLLASSLDGTLKWTLYVVWHMVSVVLVLSAVALFVGAVPRHAASSRYLVRFVSVLWCAFGALFLAVAALQPESGGLFALPQWIVLLPVGVLGVLGGRNAAVPGDGIGR